MRRPTTLGCGLMSLILAGAFAGGAAAVPGAHPSPAVSARALGASATTTAATAVTLVTGDSVRVAKNARGATIVEGVPSARARSGPAFQTFTSATRTYVIPAAARPYLGRQLDPELFDVGATSSAARIPVQLRFDGSTAPSVPGVVITSSQPGAASGYLTPASARSFGAALTKQFRADAKANFPARSTLFGATKIMSGRSGPPVATPDYPMRTLIVKVKDTEGKPAAFAFLDIYNTTDFSRYLGFAVVRNGQARVSVPLGTYGMDVGVDKLDADGNDTGFAIVTKGDVKVTKQDQVAMLDASTATAEVRVRTPRPADQQGEEFDIDVEDAAGSGSFQSGYLIFGDGKVFVAPTKAPETGTLTTAASWSLTGTPTSGTDYAYSIHRPATSGIPADETYRVSSDDIATFAFRFYVDQYTRDGGFITYPQTPDSEFGGGFSFPVQLPDNVDVYVNSIPGAVWYSTLFAPPPFGNNPFAGAIDDGPRLALAGTTYRADWARGPALPNVPVETNGDPLSFGFDCPSCRTAKRLQVVLAFATDTEPGHVWETYGRADGTPVASLRVYRDGTLVANEPDTGYVSVPAPAARTRYRVIDQVNRRPSEAVQSTSTTTDISFFSAAGTGGQLPPTWTCSLGKDCRVLPMLRTAVYLPTNLVGSVPLGTSTIGLTIAHIKGATKSAITSGSVEVRAPGGDWTALPITSAGDGSYRATLSLPAAAAGSSYDLRVSGTDADGGRITQTAMAAFAVSGS